MIGADQLVAAQHRDIAEAQRDLTHRARQTTEDALARVGRQLRRARPGSWGEAEARATRAQLRAAVVSLALAHQGHLTEALPPVMRASQKRTADYLRTLDEQYLGAVRPLRFDTLAWWEDHADRLGKVRLREYGRSFQRYGAENVLAIERAISSSVLLGQDGRTARREVWDATRRVVGERQWMVDRILRTEVAAAYNGTTLAALHAEDDPEAPMLKKLVATFDQRTAPDSVAVHGQVRKVGEPFRDPKGRLYQAPPNRPHDREILVGWRASWGESLPNYDRHTAAGDPRFRPAPVDVLPPAPIVRVAAQAKPTTAATPPRALLANLTARRLVVASQLRAAVTAAKLPDHVLGFGAVSVDPLAVRVDQLKAEYVDIRIRQSLAATQVRIAEADVVHRDIKPGNYVDFAGMAFRVLAVGAAGIKIHTPFGPAMLPAGPMPATIRTTKPDKVIRPRSRLDITVLQGMLVRARVAA